MKQTDESFCQVVAMYANTFAAAMVKLADRLGEPLPVAYNKLRAHYTRSNADDVFDEMFSGQFSEEAVSGFLESADLESKVDLFVEVASSIENHGNHEHDVPNMVYRKTDEYADDFLTSLVESGSWDSQDSDNLAERLIDALGTKEDAIRAILDV